MPSYSVAKAKDSLPQLIERAREGEDVVITRRGQIVARLTSADDLRPRDESAWQRLQELRLCQPMSQITSVELLNSMYEDED